MSLLFFFFPKGRIGRLHYFLATMCGYALCILFVVLLKFAIRTGMIDFSKNFPLFTVGLIIMAMMAGLVLLITSQFWLGDSRMLDIDPSKRRKLDIFDFDLFILPSRQDDSSKGREI